MTPMFEFEIAYEQMAFLLLPIVFLIAVIYLTVKLITKSISATFFHVISLIIMELGFFANVIWLLGGPEKFWQHCYHIFPHWMFSFNVGLYSVGKIICFILIVALFSLPFIAILNRKKK